MRILLVVLDSLAIGLLLWLIVPNWMSWSAVALPEWMHWSGFALVVAGLALLTRAHRTLSSSFSSNLEIREQHQLVMTGPYQWIRHPIYSAISLWSAGLALMTANWFVGLMPVAFALFFMLRVPLEEKMMVEAFGKEYMEYLNRTGDFVPRLIRQY